MILTRALARSYRVVVVVSILVTGCQEAPEDQLMRAARQGDLHTIEQLLEGGTPADARSPDDQMMGASPLIAALAFGHEEVALRLIAGGADVRRQDNASRDSPLHLAAARHLRNAAKRLLEKGADPNAVDERQWTPLFKAALLGDPGMVQLLLDGGSRVDHRAAHGMSVLHIAESSTIPILVRRGANVAWISSSGNTPLHEHALLGNLAEVRCLLEYGSDPATMNSEGSTALDLAQSTKRPLGGNDAKQNWNGVIDVLRAVAKQRVQGK